MIILVFLKSEKKSVIVYFFYEFMSSLLFTILLPSAFLTKFCPEKLKYTKNKNFFGIFQFSHSEFCQRSRLQRNCKSSFMRNENTDHILWYQYRIISYFNVNIWKNALAVKLWEKFCSLLFQKDSSKGVKNYLKSH